MKLQEFKDIMYASWIGQGYGYKKDIPVGEWDNVEDDEVIYAPEQAYGVNGGTTVDVGLVWTKAYFVALAGDKAEYLFRCCDWQTPSALWNEMEMEDDEDDEMEDGSV